MTLPATKEALRAAAERDAARKPISRIALFEVALADDSAEFDGVGGYGLLAVTALSWCPYEVPLASARITPRVGQPVELRLLSSVLSAMDDEEVRGVYGVNRADALYLVPVEAIAADAGLDVDFSSPPEKMSKAAERVCDAPGRTGFHLHDFRVGDVPRAYLRAVGPRSPRTPDSAVLAAFVDRVYPAFLAEH